jgi:hypothetical protein
MRLAVILGTILLAVSLLVGCGGTEKVAQTSTSQGSTSQGATPVSGYKKLSEAELGIPFYPKGKFMEDGTREAYKNMPGSQFAVLWNLSDTLDNVKSWYQGALQGKPNLLQGERNMQYGGYYFEWTEGSRTYYVNLVDNGSGQIIINLQTTP